MTLITATSTFNGVVLPVYSGNNSRIITHGTSDTEIITIFAGRKMLQKIK